MTYPVLQNLGFCRSGTNYACNELSRAFAGRVHVLHEDLSLPVARVRTFFRCYQSERIAAAAQDSVIAEWLERIRYLAETKPVLILGWSSAHLAPLLYETFGHRLRTIHMHRHPLNVAAATHIGNWTGDWIAVPPYEIAPDVKGLTPADPWARYTQISPRWIELGPFARIVYNWLERTAAALEFCERYPSVPHCRLASEAEVFGSTRYLEAIAELINVEPDFTAPGGRGERNAGWVRAIEERPLGDAWRQISQVPEAIELARSLGYQFDEPELRARAGKYQLPPTLSAQLRHQLGYWQARRRIASYLRSKALIPPSTAILGGVEPRATKQAFAEAWRSWMDFISMRFRS